MRAKNMEYNTSCLAADGKFVPSGSRFHPDSKDYCLQCLCLNGERQMCLSASCGEPECKIYQRVPKSCCTFVCHNSTDSLYESHADALSTASVRLAVSSATCLVAVIIILFLMHKLRKHRLLANIRPGVTRRSQCSETSVSNSSAYDDVNFNVSYKPLLYLSPPPYSPSDKPPAYTASSDSLTNNHAQENDLPQNGSINVVCHQGLLSMDDIAQRNTNLQSAVVESKESVRMGAPLARTPGVGGSARNLEKTCEPDNTRLTLRYDKEENYSNRAQSKMEEHMPIFRATAGSFEFNNSPGDETVGAAFNSSILRLEPIGAELSDSEQRLTGECSSNVSASIRACSSHDAGTTIQREQTTFTQYGYIDSDQTLAQVSDIGLIYGISDQRLTEIASKLPKGLIKKRNRKST